MAGIYIHIPFCKQLCYYCDFHSTTSLRRKGDMIDAIRREIVERREYLSHYATDTLYIGGGTPSLLTVEELSSIIDTVKDVWKVDSFKEFTIEVNPEDLTEEYIVGLKSLGINRLSIGIQSFIDRDLKFMNRRHNAQKAEEVVGIAQSVGFDNITIDLIYGIPEMTLEEWEYNLRKALSLGVQHISAYHLTIEDKTVFGMKQKKGEFKQVEESISEQEYELLERLTAEAGFEHYEVSNFALRGHRALHNSNYWNGIEYIGLGPSAHSFNGVGRSWNVSNNTLYIENQPLEEEILTLEDRYNEYVMTMLRTREGVSLVYIREVFGEHFLDYIIAESERIVKSGRLLHIDERLYIETKNFIVSDDIICSLFYVKNII